MPCAPNSKAEFERENASAMRTARERAGEEEEGGSDVTYQRTESTLGYRICSQSKRSEMPAPVCPCQSTRLYEKKNVPVPDAPQSELMRMR